MTEPIRCPRCGNSFTPDGDAADGHATCPSCAASPQGSAGQGPSPAPRKTSPRRAGGEDDTPRPTAAERREHVRKRYAKKGRRLWILAGVFLALFHTAAAIVLGAHLMLDHLERAREGQADNSILAPVLEPLKLRHRVDALTDGFAANAPLAGD